MSLIGNLYLQATDPGAVGTGYDWQNTTTGLRSTRNSANTAWIPLYYVDQNNGGLVPITGAAMTGALTGVTGWAPSDNANFATSLKKGGVDVATLTDLTNQITALNNTISSKINQALAGINSTTSQVNVNVAIARGNQTVNHLSTFTLPLPIFSDGTTATWGQCKYHYGIAGMGAHSASNNFSFATEAWIEDLGGSPVVLKAHMNTPAGATTIDISYFVIAVR